MNRKRWIVIAVLVGLVVSAGTAGAAASWYWRGSRYMLPAYYHKTALEDILTEHKNQIDSLTGAGLQAQIDALDTALTAHVADTTTAHGYQGQIDTLDTALTGHVGNTTTAHNYDARFVRHFAAGGTQQMLAGWVYANGTLQTDGGGFTVSRTATGTYTLTPTNSFGDWPTAVITTMDTDPPCFVRWNGLSTSGNIDFSLRDNSTLTNSDQEWCFVLTGPH